MPTVQIVIDEQVLTAADEMARQTHTDRSAYIEAALRAHNRAQKIRALEEQDREAYRRFPQTEEERDAWKGETQWLDD